MELISKNHIIHWKINFDSKNLVTYTEMIQHPLKRHFFKTLFEKYN